MSDVNTDTGIILEALNNKADRDLNNTQPQADYVVESQLPTSENNYTWYRLYKSGWLEQGGFYPSNFEGSKTFDFPKTMADTNYTLLTGPGCSDVNGMHGKDYVTARTVNGFTYTNQSLSGNFKNNNFSWEVKGMSAQS